ncbi:MAG: hypothetical protein U0930_14285 [Pirellulales bacterium]
MSWHTNAVLIHSDFDQDFDQLFERLDLNPFEMDSEVEFDSVASSSNDGIGVSFIDGWTVLFGGFAMYSIASENLAAISEQFDIFEMMLEGSSDTAGFSWYQVGAKIREYLIQADEVIKDEGEPLDIEQLAFASGDAEQAILQIMTNLTLPFDKLESARFTLFDVE